MGRKAIAQDIRDKFTGGRLRESQPFFSKELLGFGDTHSFTLQFIELGDQAVFRLEIDTATDDWCFYETLWLVSGNQRSSFAIERVSADTERVGDRVICTERYNLLLPVDVVTGLPSADRWDVRLQGSKLKELTWSLDDIAKFRAFHEAVMAIEADPQAGGQPQGSGCLSVVILTGLTWVALQMMA